MPVRIAEDCLVVRYQGHCSHLSGVVPAGGRVTGTVIEPVGDKPAAIELSELDPTMGRQRKVHWCTNYCRRFSDVGVRTGFSGGLRTAGKKEQT